LGKNECVRYQVRSSRQLCDERRNERGQALGGKYWSSRGEYTLVGEKKYPDPSRIEGNKSSGSEAAARRKGEILSEFRKYGEREKLFA